MLGDAGFAAKVVSDPWGREVLRLRKHNRPFPRLGKADKISNRLENVLQCELYDPRIAGSTIDLAESVAVEICRGIPFPEAIRDVICLRSKFQLLSLTKLERS